MFGTNNTNTNNQGSKGPSITTMVKNLFCDLSCIRLSYWADMLSLRFYPCSGTSTSGLFQYDYSKKVSTAISPEKCHALVKIIEEKFIPAMDEVKKTGALSSPISVAIGVGNNGNLLGIKYDMDTSGKPALFITLYTGVSADEKAPLDGSISYRFNKASILVDYQPQTGAHVEELVEMEFIYFYNLLKSINASNSAAAHSIASNQNVSKGGKATGGTQGSYGNQYQPQQQYAAPPANYSAPISDFPTGLPY